MSCVSCGGEREREPGNEGQREYGWAGAADDDREQVGAQWRRSNAAPALFSVSRELMFCVVLLGVLKGGRLDSGRGEVGNDGGSRQEWFLGLVFF